MTDISKAFICGYGVSFMSEITMGIDSFWVGFFVFLIFAAPFFVWIIRLYDRNDLQSTAKDKQ